MTKHKSSKPSGPPLRPQDVAQALRISHERGDDPVDPTDLDGLARWGRLLGLHYEVRRAQGWKPTLHPITGDLLTDFPVKDREARDYLRDLVSRHPERFAAVVEAVALMRERYIRSKIARLEACGMPWASQRVLRFFWRDRHGRERLRRQVGIHRCKAMWCPTCDRTRQAKIAGEVEQALVLAQDWGFHAGHARLFTLTTPNGPNIEALREELHTAFRRLQNTRWWNHNVFGFVRGSEVKTGKDGLWNAHAHILVILWRENVPYDELADAWDHALGRKREDDKHFVQDVQTLERLAWGRKDGGEGRLLRRNLARATRYITKYLHKGEELRNLAQGPGGLRHLDRATRGMRRSAHGGGLALLRRLAKVLMPRQLHAAEEVLNEGPLHEGRRAMRVEEMDPETGEVREVAFHPIEDGRRAALRAFGEALETNPVPPKGIRLPGRVVGIPCGPKLRYRRIGEVPLKGRAPRVREWERWERAGLARWQRLRGTARGNLRRLGGRPLVVGALPALRLRAAVTLRVLVAWRASRPLEGFRRLIPRWGLLRWDRIAKTTGTRLRGAAVLPADRFAWKTVEAGVLAELIRSPWAAERQRALEAYARHAIGQQDLLDVLRAADAAGDDRAYLGTRQDGTRIVTTRRRKLARKLQASLLAWMTEDPERYLERHEAVRAQVARLNSRHVLAITPKPEPTFLEGYL